MIELALLPFEYERDTGRLVRVDEDGAFSTLRHPSFPIPPESTRLHGISDADVAGKTIDVEQVRTIVESAHLIIAHNAAFDRPMVEKHWPVFEQKHWACSFVDIDWKSEGLGSAKLDYLLMRQRWFHDGHRAMSDALATAFLLTLPLPVSGKSGLKALLDCARRPLRAVRAEETALEQRAALKQRGMTVRVAATIAPLISFFDTLRQEFELAIVTLNYDDLIYRAMPGVETGFDPSSGRFDERRLIDRPAWSCMLHLHGSVHFDMRMDSDDLHEIYWQEDMNATFSQNASGRGHQNTTEGLAFPTSSIIAGYGKTLQMLRRPFRTYYSELDRLVMQSNAILCLGYGFADAHLNEALSAYRDERKRPVAIVDYCGKPGTTMTSCACDIDEPSRQITTALGVFNTDCASMTWNGYSHPGTIADLNGAPELSNNPDRPLAIWYTGMLAACNDPAAIIAQL